MQQTWLRAWSSIGQFQGGATDDELVRTFHGWIRTILRNGIRNSQRGPPRPSPLVVTGASSTGGGPGCIAGPPASGPTASQEAIAREELEWLKHALEKVLASVPENRRDRVRKVLEMYLEDNRHREIGKKLKCDASTVGDDLREIVELCRRELQRRSHEHAER